MPLAMPMKLGPYEVLDLLGSGGMGEVYRARDTRLGRLVAIKVLAREIATDPDRVRRFLQEARAISAVNHPNIAQLYDVGESEGVLFLVMELIRGESLDSRMAASPLPLPLIAQYGAAIAEALAEAHRSGVTHRDMKPGNVMVTDSGLIKVLDFGLAKVTADAPTSGSTELKPTSPGVMAGTLHYMSPEQALGNTADHRSDIFALGVVLYQMSTGRLPFTGESVFAVLEQIVRVEPPSITTVSAQLPPALDGVIRRCLAKSPAARYDNAAEVADALRNIESAPAARQQVKPSILVLPFSDISAGEENRYFSDGLTEEIITTLSQIGSLAVVSRTTAMKLRTETSDIRTLGRDMNVAYVLEGSVRKAGNAVRIVADLVDTRTDTHVWADSYRGTLDDIFEIQEKVASSIADALLVHLSPRDKLVLTRRETDDAVAYDLVLRARYLLTVWTNDNLTAAFDLFAQAIARDHRYAAAYAGLAAACVASYERVRRDETFLTRAIDNGLKALMNDASSADAYAALALAYFHRSETAEARQACERAIELAPDTTSGYWTLGQIHHRLGENRQAMEMFSRVIDLDPDFYPAYYRFRMEADALGERWRYEAHLQKLITDVLPRHLEAHPDDVRAWQCFGFETAYAGRPDEGLKYLDRACELAPEDPSLLSCRAGFFAVFGEKRQAMDALERAAAAGYCDAEFLLRDPDFSSLHDDPEFQKLVRKLERRA